MMDTQKQKGNDDTNDHISSSSRSNWHAQCAKETTTKGTAKPKVPPKPKGLNKMVGRGEQSNNNGTTKATTEGGTMPTMAGRENARRMEEEKNNNHRDGDQQRAEEEGMSSVNASSSKWGPNTNKGQPQQQRATTVAVVQAVWSEPHAHAAAGEGAEDEPHCQEKMSSRPSHWVQRPKCKPPLPAKPTTKDSEQNAAGDRRQEESTATAENNSGTTRCQTVASATSFSPSPAPAKVRKPLTCPPPPPVGKMHKTANSIPKLPANPPPPPPKQWATTSNGDQNGTSGCSIYEEIRNDEYESEKNGASEWGQIENEVPKRYKKSAMPATSDSRTHWGMVNRFQKTVGRERDERRRTTQLEQWGRIKREQAEDNWEEEEKRMGDSAEQQHQRTTMGTSVFLSAPSSSAVCCCSVCLNSSPLLCRSVFLPSGAGTLSSPNSALSPPTAERNRSRIARSEIIEHKIGRISNEFRQNLTRGMDKIRFRMALLNTRHCPSAHFCAIGKKLFPQQQQDNAKNANAGDRGGVGSAPTIGANGKSTFYVSEEEVNEEEEEDDFGDDWSTSSGGSVPDEQRTGEEEEEGGEEGTSGGMEEETEQKQQQQNRESIPSASFQCLPQRPSLWEEIETEYQQRKRQQKQETFSHFSMDPPGAVKVGNESFLTTASSTDGTDLHQTTPISVPLSPSANVPRSCSLSSVPIAPDPGTYTSQLSTQQPLYQIYYMLPDQQHQLNDLLVPSSSATSFTASSSSSAGPCSYTSDGSVSDNLAPSSTPSSVTPLRLEPIAELSGLDSSQQQHAGGEAERGGGGMRSNEQQEKVEEMDSVCNDPTDIASVSSSSAVNVRRHSSTASSSADSGRADSLSRLSYPNTPNMLTVRRERLLGASKCGSQRSLWCELPEVKEAGLLDQMDDGQKKLQEAYFEVITSEASYLRSLSFLISHFMCSPELLGTKAGRSVVTNSERKHLFSNIVAIRDCSERLLCDLETRLKQSLVLTELCDIICDYYECHFNPYINYCSNQVYQDRTLKALKASNPLFSACIQRLEADRQCQGLDMRSFLMLPMQRITRYPLLIFAIQERLDPDQIQHSVATRALTLATQFVHNCNEGARRMAQTEQLLEIDSKIVYSGSELRRVPLVSSGRYLVKNGRISQLVVERRAGSAMRTRQLMLFLFSDLLLITKGRSNGTFVCKDYAPRRFVAAEPLESNDLSIPSRALHSISSNNSLHLMLCTLAQNARGNQRVELLLNADSESDRERWLTAMRPPTCANTAEEKIYSEWDCPQAMAVHNYAVQQEDELGLSKGDLVNILRKMSDGWFYGERMRDSKAGWFPSSYVQQVINDHHKANNYRQRLRLIQQRSADTNVFRRGSSHQTISSDGEMPSLANSRQPAAADHHHLPLNRLRRMSSPFGVISRDG